MKILYLTYDGLTDPLGQSQILPYLKGLVEKEHEITVISFEKSGVREDRVLRNDPVDHFNEGPGSEAGRVSIEWIPLTYHKNPPVLSTLFDIWKLKQTSTRIVTTNQIDIVHCRSYITSLVGLWLKRKYGIKFIFDMRGFWADERVEGGLWNLKNPVYRWIYRYFKRKEKEFIVEADAIVSLTENARKGIGVQGSGIRDQGSGFRVQGSGFRIRSLGQGMEGEGDQDGNIQSKIHVIPTCVDTNLFDPGKIDVNKKEETRRSIGIDKDDFVLLYLGSLGTWYMLDEMMRFFIELKKIRQEARFLFLTKDGKAVRSWLLARRDQVSALSSQVGGRELRNDPVDNFNEVLGSAAGRGGIDDEWKELEQSIIVKQAKREDVPLYISLCKASIFFIKPTFSKIASSATKMGEVMAMGKPVITNTGWGDVEEIIEHEKDGLLVEDFIGKTYQETISQLDSVLQTPVKEIRGKAIRFLSLERGVMAYDRIYQMIINDKL